MIQKWEAIEGFKGTTNAIYHDSWIQGMDTYVEYIRTDLHMIKKSLNNFRSSDASSGNICKSKHFFGVHDSKALTKYLWGMEKYFDASDIPEGKRVSVATVYYECDVIEWWRRYEATCEPQRQSLQWAELNIKLRVCYMPNNSLWTVQDQLRNLRQKKCMNNQ